MAEISEKPMKIIYYDCFAGISGDMNLGAMIDLGVPLEYLKSELNKLHVEGYELECVPSIKMGISGTQAKVILRHNHSGHSHHEHKAGHSNQEHRNLHDIEQIIISSSLNDFVMQKSMEIFRHIAEAEAKIHSKPVEQIHFHEVGALDSIIDIVGAAICMDFLKPDRIIASTVELGSGYVNCAHGTYPVPAPATARILEGIPVKKGTVDKEATTPTGAAILKVFANEFTDQISFQIKKTGYGVGHHDFSIPNILRVHEGELSKSVILDTERSEAVLIESNIDDMNPEQYEFIMDWLFEAGAQDVFFVPVIMKKSRPAIQLKVLCARTDQTAIEEILFRHTTSLGIRYTNVNKSMLQRNMRTIDTEFGKIRIKEAILNGKVIKYKPEYEDCVKASKVADKSLQEIYKEIDRILDKLK